MSEHTPGLLYCVEKNPTIIRSDEAKMEVARASPVYMDRSERIANARRLVACWNACAGIPTETLECDGWLNIKEMVGRLIERAQSAEASAEEAERLIREGVEWMEAVLSAFAKNGIGEDRGEEHLSQQIAEHRAFLARNTPEERKA